MSINRDQFKFKIKFIVFSVIIEKLLRTTEVKRIYVLLRSKSGQDIQERFSSWESHPVSGRKSRKLQELSFERIVVKTRL